MTGFASAFLHVIVLSVVLQIAAFAAPFQIQPSSTRRSFTPTRISSPCLRLHSAPWAFRRWWKPCEAGRSECSAIS